MDQDKIKKRFPSLLGNPDITYLDSASTTQKPDIVIAAVNEYMSEATANAGRGNYAWASQVSRKIEDVREQVAGFIGSKNSKEVVFTSGATESLNAIAYSWGLLNLKDGDEIIFSPLDHTSNILPWQNLKNTLAAFGVKINLVSYEITYDGHASAKNILEKITPKTRLICLTHIHNLFGTRTEVEEFRKWINPNILISLDCSQSVGHIPIDVHKLGVDFVSFSGHKMFAGTGTGILWVSKKIHDQLGPFMAGGHSGIKMPELLEAGTPNIAGIISLGKAIEFINEIGIEVIRHNNLELTQHTVTELKALDKVEFLPGVAFCDCHIGYGIVSFRLPGISSTDAGFALNSKGIYLRAGDHCLASEDNRDAIRVSAHIYNSKEDIDKLIAEIKKIIS